MCLIFLFISNFSKLQLDEKKKRMLMVVSSEVPQMCESKLGTGKQGHLSPKFSLLGNSDCYIVSIPKMFLNSNTTNSSAGFL